MKFWIVAIILTVPIVKIVGIQKKMEFLNYKIFKCYFESSVVYSNYSCRVAKIGKKVTAISVYVRSVKDMKQFYVGFFENILKIF
jgi:hypothetical protein